MEKLTKDILKYLGNNHTKVEQKQNFKGNYYSNITDTIYIAKSFSQSKLPKGMNNIDKRVAELIVICHECIHSIQNKRLHILNTVLSNVGMILTMVCIIIGFFDIIPIWLKLLSCLCLSLAIAVRLTLEIDAISRSTKVAKSFIENEAHLQFNKEDILLCENYIKKHKAIALTQMIIDKFIALIVICIIK